MANHKDKKILFNGEMIVVQRGQYLTSMVKLADKWMWSRPTVLKFLKLLENDKMITRLSDNTKTLITIENYSVFQDFVEDDLQPTLQPLLQPTLQECCNPLNNPLYTNNNDKNVKNDKNINNRAFVKPTINEVEEYCNQRNKGVDAETFYDFYESKGWMVGKNKMKDWKAAVRTWEKSRCGSKPSNYKQTTNNDLNPQITAQLRALEEQQLASMPDIDSMSDEDIDRLIRGEV